MRNRLITGIGLSNYKTLDEYTFIPIKDITTLIGKNGSGKSSCWQVLSLLSNLNQDYRPNDPDAHKYLLIESLLSLNKFKEYAGNAAALLSNKTKPLIIELSSNFLVLDTFINNEELLLRFEFIDYKEELKISSFEFFTKEGKHLLWEVRFNPDNSCYEGEFSDYFGQFILNVLYKISNKDYEKKSKDFFELVRDLENLKTHDISSILIDCDESFFDYSLQKVQIYQKWGEKFSDFVILVKDQLQFEIPKIKISESHLFQEMAELILEALKGTFFELLNEIKDCIYVNRQLIGTPTRFISKTNEQELYLIDLEKSIIAKDLRKEFIKFILRTKKTFNFKEIPRITDDDTGDFLLIKLDTEDLRNSGSGYWSLTYILQVISHAVRSKKRIIILEEPEAHLHPDFQAKLADFLIDASKTFLITFIVETHSEYLTRRMQIRVFEAHNKIEIENPTLQVNHLLEYSNPNGIKLDKENVIINYFKHSSERVEGMPICINIQISETGMLSSAYPLTFAGVANADAKILFDLKSRL